MSPTTFSAISMIIYFVGMIMIGLWAYARTSDLDDYMLAGRDLNPFVASPSTSPPGWWPAAPSSSRPSAWTTAWA